MLFEIKVGMSDWPCYAVIVAPSGAVSYPLATQGEVIELLESTPVWFMPDDEVVGRMVCAVTLSRLPECEGGIPYEIPVGVPHGYSLLMGLALKGAIRSFFGEFGLTPPFVLLFEGELVWRGSKCLPSQVFAARSC